MSNHTDLAPSNEDLLILAFFACADELDAMIAQTSPTLADPLTFRQFRETLRDYMVAQLNLVSFGRAVDGNPASTPPSLTSDEHDAVRRGSAQRYVAAFARIVAETDLVTEDPNTVKLQQFVVAQDGLLG